MHNPQTLRFSSGPAISFCVAALLAAPAGSSIVGGKSIGISEAPYQLLLKPIGCGAVWLGGRWVMTAAHCVQGQTPSSQFIYAGVTKIYSIRDPDRLPIKRMIIHPNYRNNRPDIALLEMVSDISHPLARPIRYATPADVTAGLTQTGAATWATGWGGMGRDITPFPDSLQAILSKVHQKTEPFVIYWGGQGGAPAGSCVGDSGGPLAIKDAAGAWVLAGISSFITSHCGDPNSPSGYARVSAVADWVKEVTGVSPLSAAGRDAPGLFWQGSRFRLDRPRTLDISILSLAGVRLRGVRRGFPAGEHGLPWADLPAGRYLLRVTDEKGAVLASAAHPSAN